MKKNFIFVVLMVLVSYSQVFSDKAQSWNIFEIDEDNFKYVCWMECFDNACFVQCPTGGFDNCTFNTGLGNGCVGCDFSKTLYDNSRANDLVEFVEDQIINNNILTGTFNDNIFNISNGMTYFRTVTWSTNSANVGPKITITVYETNFIMQ